MRMLKREQLIPLRDALRDVQRFIRRVEENRMPYYYLQFDHMINNIEICLQFGDEDMQQISSILLRDWQNANHELIGVSVCSCDQQDSMRKAEEVYCFIELLSDVEEYFMEKKAEEEQDEQDWQDGQDEWDEPEEWEFEQNKW